MTPNNAEPPVFGQHNGYDIYPMPMFARLEAANLAETVGWYREALGFGVMFEMPVLVHLRRAKYRTSSSCPVALHPPPMPASHSPSPLTARSIRCLHRPDKRKPVAAPASRRCSDAMERPRDAVERSRRPQACFPRAGERPEASARMQAIFETPTP